MPQGNPNILLAYYAHDLTVVLFPRQCRQLALKQPEGQQGASGQEQQQPPSGQAGESQGAGQSSSRNGGDYGEDKVRKIIGSYCFENMFTD